MRTIIFLILITLSSFCFSQNMKIEGVTKVDSVSQNELYLRARTWFINSFKDAKSVIQLDDSENYIIIGKGNFQYNPGRGESFFFTTNGIVEFKLKIMCRDGRYKIEIYEFEHIATNYKGSVGKSFGYITNSMICPTHLNKHNTRTNDDAWMRIKSAISIEINLLAKSLKLAMETSTGSEDDW